MTQQPSGCRFRHIFIVTYGRSGSTLLMGYLNSFPGICVRGENNGALLGIYRSIRSVQKARYGGAIAKRPTHPWFGFHEVDAARYERRLIEVFVQEMLRPLSDTETIGFKEIRHGDIFIDDLDDYIDFLLNAFDRAGVIMHTRDIKKTLASGWIKESEVIKKRVSDLHDAMSASRFHGDPRCHITHHDSLWSDQGHAMALARFLGREFDRESWCATLAERHSY